MKLKLFISFLLTFVMISCGKKTQVKGVVYSRHHVPVANVQIAYEESVDGSPINSYEDVVRTKDNGEYVFNIKTSKRYTYYVRCTCDSGFKKTEFARGKTNNLDLDLQ